MPGTWIAVLLGLGEGIFVGTALVAFLTVLGLVPRLCHLTATGQYLYAYEWALVLGPLLGTLLAGWSGATLRGPGWVAAPVGLLMGMFVGMLTGALAEVLDVIPILGRRIGVQSRVGYLVLMVVVGKTLGSLLYWIVPGLSQ